MRLGESRFAISAVLLGVAVGISACMLDRKPGGEGPHVADGKVYQSDNPTYDEYFRGVYALQKETATASEDEAKAREPLERALGTRAATPERVVELTKEHMTRTSHEGPPVRLVVAGVDAEKDGSSPQKVSVSVHVPDEAAIPPSQREFVHAIGDSTHAEAEILERFAPVVVKARALLQRHQQLTKSVDRDFTTQSRRDEVRRELDATKPALTSAADRADKAAGSARWFLKAMAEALPASGDAPTVAAKDEKPAPGKRTKPEKNAPHAPAKTAVASPPPKPHAAQPRSSPAPRTEDEKAAPVPEAPKPEPVAKPARPADDFNP